MKNLLFLLFVFSVSCSGGHHKVIPAKKEDTGHSSFLDGLKADLDLTNIDSTIIRTDTIKDDKSNAHITLQSYDSKGKPVKRRIVELFGQGAIVTRFDSAGHIIYEEHSTDGIRWQAYRYTFDTHSHMIRKEGYGSGDSGSKITYIYQGDKLVEETKRQAGSIKTIHY